MKYIFFLSIVITLVSCTEYKDVAVSSNPESVIFYNDNSFNSPTYISLPISKEVTISFEREGYKTLVERVIIDDSTDFLNFDLIPMEVTLLVEANYSDFKISIDDKDFENGGKILPGSYELKITKEGFIPYSKNIEIEINNDKKINILLPDEYGISIVDDLLVYSSKNLNEEDIITKLNQYDYFKIRTISETKNSYKLEIVTRENFNYFTGWIEVKKNEVEIGYTFQEAVENHILYNVEKYNKQSILDILNVKSVWTNVLTNYKLTFYEDQYSYGSHDIGPSSYIFLKIEKIENNTLVFDSLHSDTGYYDIESSGAPVSIKVIDNETIEMQGYYDNKMDKYLRSEYYSPSMEGL